MTGALTDEPGDSPAPLYLSLIAGSRGRAALVAPVLPEPLWLTAPLGLLPRLVRYLWERRVHAALVLPIPYRLREKGFLRRRWKRLGHPCGLRA